MSIGRKLAHKAEAIKGATKKYVGRATGNTRMRNEGFADQAIADAKGQGPKSKTP
ncbi:CsbD family protein [Mycobacterium sp. DL592]|uniref:CsbD family protein n=1 Tax=Mycobacterium sp. DL592 TaxID=2675524 RepID=UPI001420F765|nr:CsbD family protein [Mycobacterium sp. DL592]